MIGYETPLDALEGVVAEVDGLLFSGGVDVDPSCYGAPREPECGESNPARDALELKLLPLCLCARVPVLGICRGCQIINAALGGTLTQDVPKRFGKVHQMVKGAPSAFDHMCASCRAPCSTKSRAATCGWTATITSASTASPTA